MPFDMTAFLVVFIAVGMPVIFGFTLIAHRLRLQQDQYKMLMDERRLMIERGATDLPPIELPRQQAFRLNPMRHLRIGILALAVTAALGIDALLHDGRITMFGNGVPSSVMLLTGLVGVAFLVIFFTGRAYGQQDGCGPKGG